MKFRIENGSLDALFERVRFAAPELIELNKTPKVNSLIIKTNIQFSGRVIYLLALSYKFAL